MYQKRQNIRQFIKSSEVITLIELETVHGSTPRNEGTWMLVSEDQIFKTIGGGQLEYMAIEKARYLLSKKNNDPIEMQIPLGPHIGQCCGGTVNLTISVLNNSELQHRIKLVEEELNSLPKVYIFGAGHVGNALAEALSLLPVYPIIIDTRADELTKAPADIETRLTVMPETEVRGAKAGSAFVILTHDHALDFLIAREALLRDDAAYVGMIGSKTKRATFRNWLRRENGSETGIEKLACPIGKQNVRDKRPEVIAALTTAEIIAYLNAIDVGESSMNVHSHAKKISEISR